MTSASTLSAVEIDQFHQRGYCILRKLMPIDLITAWHEAFGPLYRGWRACGLPDNRGPHRNYLDLPFSAPFSDPAVYEHPVVLDIIASIIGDDPVLLHFGTDTPEFGSEAQSIHADVVSLFPETGLITPTFCITVNFPLVDVTETNGPFEVAPGTHLLSIEDGQERIARGDIEMQTILMERGDVMIRDPRALHRGTTNSTGEPRPVAVLSYHRPWYRHPGFEPMAISSTVRDMLSERARRLLRLHLAPSRLA